jgi:hypothetical protein
MSKVKCFRRFSIVRETKNICFPVCSEKYTRMIKYFDFISGLQSDVASIFLRMIVKFLTSLYGCILVFVLLTNFCQNLTYSMDSNAGVTHQYRQIGTKSGSGWFPTPRFPSPNLETRGEL